MALTLSASPSVSAFESRSVLHGDLNGDGRLDRVTLSADIGGCITTVELGDGSGGYAPPESHRYQVAGQSGCPDMGVIVDLGGDGTVELVLAWFNGADHQAGNKDLLVLRDYVPVDGFSAIFQPSGIGIADFNGDGLQDVYEWTDQGDGFQTYLNTPGSQLVPGPISFCAGMLTFDLADFNRDGGMDVVISYLLEGCGDGPSTGVVVLYGDGARTSLHAVEVNAMWSVEALDANGDGVPDVKTVNGETGEITHFLSDGGHAFFPSPTAVDDVVETRRREPKVIKVLENDAATSAATVSIITEPQYGFVTVTSPSEVTYVREAMHNRIDYFVYQLLQDGKTDTASVTVRVKG